MIACYSSRPDTPGALHGQRARPALALPWGLTGVPVMFDKDLAAPTAAEALAKGLLLAYEDFLARYVRTVPTGDLTTAVRPPPLPVGPQAPVPKRRAVMSGTSPAHESVTF